MSDTHASERQELERFANAEGQPNQPRGGALVRPTTSITPLGAQHVARVRPSEGELKLRIAERAAAAGERWFYRFPVRRKDGGTDWIEGPSIKCAMGVLMMYGNAVVEVREVDVGDAWVFYARFTDYETGASVERSYRQHKGQASIKSKDPQRALDLVYQIGQSKAERNVICKALEGLTDHAFECAQASLVNKIGQDIEAWRERTLDGLARMPVEVHRVERAIGKPAKAWVAPDIARIVAMMRGVADGMATIEDTFPPDQQVLDRDAASTGTGETGAAPSAKSVHAEAPSQPNTSSAAGTTPLTPTAAGKTAAGSSGPSPPDTLPAGSSPSPNNKLQYIEMVQLKCARSGAADAELLLPWFVSDAQRKMRNAIGMMKSDTDEARAIVEAAVARLRAGARDERDF